ncbi:MAG: PucR family transcriptional regulator [Acidimicrobiales bacterium]
MDLHLPTVAEILALPEVQRGRPTIEAARNAIDRPVRWVHVSEITDIGHLLQGGELILSTGVAFPSADDGLVRYINDLVAAQVTGVVIELGRRFAALPAALVQSAEAHSLPLIALHTEVPFVAITEAIHSIIVNTQLRQLQLSEVVHRSFHSLAAEASDPQDIVHQVALLADCPVVFENAARHVLAFAGGTTSGTEVLDHWEQRSRRAAWANHTSIMGEEHWLTTPVSARGQVWGRLILLPSLPTSPLQRTILEQGATTLALHLLIERDKRLLEHQTHRTLITDIIDHRYSSPDEIHTRTESLGVATRRQTLVAMIVRSERDAPLADIARHAAARDEVTAVSRALTDATTTGLVGPLEPGRLGVLISAPTDTRMKNLIEVVTRAVHGRTGKLTPPGSTVIGVGSPVNAIDELRYSFAEANEAADAARSLPGDRLFVTTADIRLRGLVHLLRDDPRLQSYTERELGPLIAYDERHHTDLVATLAAYLEAGGNKSRAAAAAHTTRATFYHHLSRIEEVLKCDLESPESRYSLYVALTARRSLED